MMAVTHAHGYFGLRIFLFRYHSSFWATALCLIMNVDNRLILKLVSNYFCHRCSEPTAGQLRRCIGRCHRDIVIDDVRKRNHDGLGGTKGELRSVLRECGRLGERRRWQQSAAMQQDAASHHPLGNSSISYRYRHQTQAPDGRRHRWHSSC